MSRVRHSKPDVKRERLARGAGDGGGDDLFRARHGRQRSETTLRRAYANAIEAGFVDAADTAGVMDVIQIGERAASELTREAREVRKAAMKSLAMALAAKGVSQRKIAERLGVDHKSVAAWVGNYGGDAETPHKEDLPSEATLEALATEIDAAARKDVLPAVRAELEAALNERIDALRQQLEADISAEREQSRSSGSSASSVGLFCGGISRRKIRARENESRRRPATPLTSFPTSASTATPLR